MRNPSLFGRLLKEASFTPGSADDDRLPQFDVEFADEESLDQFFRCLYVEESGDECAKISQSWKNPKEEERIKPEESTDGKEKLNGL